jgi:DNA-binding phage protein
VDRIFKDEKGEVVMENIKTTNWNDFIVKELKYDNELLDLYIKDALEDFQKTKDMKSFLYKLQHIVEAKGGMSTVAKKSNLSRSGLYKMFHNQNFKVGCFVNILDSIGLEVLIKPSKKYKYL